MNPATEKSENESDITLESPEEGPSTSSGPSKPIPIPYKHPADPWIRSRIMNIDSEKLASSEWSRIGQSGPEEQFAAFNRAFEIPTYSYMDYQDYLRHEDWTMDETDHLFDLARRYDLKFTVMHDRWDRESFPLKAIDDMKERYYSCVSVLSKFKDGPGSSKQMKNYVFDKEHEISRKEQPELLSNRTSEESAEISDGNKENKEEGQKELVETKVQRPKRLRKIEKPTQKPSNIRSEKSVLKPLEEVRVSDEPKEKKGKKRGGKVPPGSKESIQNIIEGVDHKSESGTESENVKEATSLGVDVAPGPSYFLRSKMLKKK